MTLTSRTDSHPDDGKSLFNRYIESPQFSKHHELTAVHFGEELSPCLGCGGLMILAGGQMRTPGWVSPVSSVPYTSVHSMVTRAGLWSQVSLALLASLMALVSGNSWYRGGWPGRPRGLGLWVLTHNVMTSDILS